MHDTSNSYSKLADSTRSARKDIRVSHLSAISTLYYHTACSYDCCLLNTDGYPNPPAAPLYYGRQAVVLGPNGMPHYGSSSNTAFAANQETQSEPFQGGILQQQGSYDFGDQDVVKQET
jgi:hypothetical protein